MQSKNIFIILLTYFSFFEFIPAQSNAADRTDLTVTNESAKVYQTNTALATDTNIISSPSMASAGAGMITGKVIDKQTGQPIPFATVSVEDAEGNDTGGFATTDINGIYTVNSVALTNIVLIFDSDEYLQAALPVKIEKPETSVNVSLKPAGKTGQDKKRLRDVRVKAQKISGSEATLLSKRRKSMVVQDAIGSEEIAKSPDSDAGDAARRVTGITVVDNNIYIRGLGERYAAVMLADSAIPSPDPDKRVVPLDIFPVSLLDNLTILKTFAPQMPGEFCGGIIKISPRDYPEENFFKISVGTGMDLDVIPFHNSYWTYKGGQFDWLGYDDGTRTLPGAVPDNIANIANQTENKMEAIGESFPYILTPYKKKAFLPHKISISFGDSRLTPGKARIGYLVSAMYKGSVDEKAKASINRTYDGDLQKEYSNVNSARKVKIGLLGSLGVIPLPAHKFRFTSFYSHNHKDNTIVEIGQTGLETRVYKKYILNFENNDLFFTQLTGTHFLKKLNNIIVKWNGSFGRAKHSEPDKRSTELRTEMGDDDPESDGYFLQYFHRIFREFLEHKENSLGFNTEIQIPYKQWQGLNSRLYSGADLSIKKRDTKERIFQYEDGDIYCDKDHGEPIEDYLNDENMVGFASTPDEIDLHEVTDSSSYIGKLKILAFYLKTDLPLMRRLQFSGGIRYENSLMEMYDNNIWENDIVLIRDDALTRHNFLPSANFIFSPHHNINLRLSYSKSIARPDFREAVAISYNLNEGGKQVFGNDDLKQVDIHSADIRFELYPSELEIFSVSAFYKYIQKPIELLELFTSNPDEMKYKYRNGEFAHNLGMEIEIKKNFGFLNRFFKDFYISGNFAYIYSQIKVKDRPASVYAQKKRPMQGQSPYVVNATIGYQNKNIGITSTLLLNMVGKRIAAVTIIPGGYEKEVGDVYEKPAPELDFVFKKTFSQKGSLKFSFKNILDKEYKIIRDEKIFGRQKKGRSINLSYSLKIQN